jgi:hypothetical protein
LVNLKTKTADDGYQRKAKEKPVLRSLGARTFSRGLDPKLPLVEPTFCRQVINRQGGPWAKTPEIREEEPVRFPDTGAKPLVRGISEPIRYTPTATNTSGPVWAVQRQ